MSIQKDTKTEDIKFEIIKLKCKALIWIALHIKKTEDAKFVMQPLFFILREQRAKVRACTRPWRLPR